MKLRNLFRELSEFSSDEIPAIEIGGLALDSRQVRPGDLFLAVHGTDHDGHSFIANAVQRGAVAVLGQESLADRTVPYFKHPDSREAAAKLAAAWFDFPARRLTMIGVTGTDGKTTTAILLHRMLEAAGRATGLITTIGALLGSRSMDTGLHVTTPDALTLQANLAEMVEAGITHCVLEATSHGLAQKRVETCEFDLAVFTNITHEHLDYHGDWEAYFEAKAHLLTLLDKTVDKPFVTQRKVIVNRDEPTFGRLKERSPEQVLAYGWRRRSDYRANDVASTSSGLEFRIDWKGGQAEIASPLLGDYNVWNILAAFSAAEGGLALDPALLAEAVASVGMIPGRMEYVRMGQAFDAVVDFAHTPASLERSLQAARSLTAGRIIAVFGSAGMRDRAKRQLMAQTSLENADLTVLTAEDPRTESLATILDEMAQGANSAGGEETHNYWRIADRREAIRFAVDTAGPQDMIILCGKGHEQSMCFGEIEYPWDDRTALRAALAEQLGIEGPNMPELPLAD